jgi:hypothetical protein
VGVEVSASDWPRALLEFLLAVLAWLAEGVRQVVEYHAEPVIQARWRVTW